MYAFRESLDHVPRCMRMKSLAQVICNCEAAMFICLRLCPMASLGKLMEVASSNSFSSATCGPLVFIVFLFCLLAGLAFSAVNNVVSACNNRRNSTSMYKFPK